MLKRKTFKTPTEAIRFMKAREISMRNIVYIASKKNTCELVYKNTKE